VEQIKINHKIQLPAKSGSSEELIKVSSNIKIYSNPSKNSLDSPQNVSQTYAVQNMPYFANMFSDIDNKKKDALDESNNL